MVVRDGDEGKRQSHMRTELLRVSTRKHLFLMSLVGVCFFFFSGMLYARGPIKVNVSSGKTQVTFLEGVAEVMTAEAKVWIPLAVGNTLKDADQVRTGENARLEIVLPDNTVLRFAENTSFTIVSVRFDETARDRNIKVEVTLGKTWANIAKNLGVKSNIELSCENAVTGVRGTIYRMNVYRDKSALVRVYDGAVFVWGGSPKKSGDAETIAEPHRIDGPTKIPGPRKVSLEEWTYIVRSMQQIAIRADGTSEEPRGFAVEEDRNDWVTWNQARDGSHAKN